MPERPNTKEEDQKEKMHSRSPTAIEGTSDLPKTMYWCKNSEDQEPGAFRKFLGFYFARAFQSGNAVRQKMSRRDNRRFSQGGIPEEHVGIVGRLPPLTLGGPASAFRKMFGGTSISLRIRMTSGLNQSQKQML
jgi:hypothetical protein